MKIAKRARQPGPSRPPRPTRKERLEALSKALKELQRSFVIDMVRNVTSSPAFRALAADGSFLGSNGACGSLFNHDAEVAAVDRVCRTTVPIDGMSFSAAYWLAEARSRRPTHSLFSCMGPDELSPFENRALGIRIDRLFRAGGPLGPRRVATRSARPSSDPSSP